MRRLDLLTYKEVARDLGVTRQLVGELVRVYGLQPHPMVGPAKGLTPKDRRFLRRVLKIRPKAESISA